MVQTVNCPGCKGTFRVRPEQAGKRMKCPKCGGPIQVPAAAGEEWEFVEDDAAEPAQEGGKARRRAAEKPAEEAPRTKGKKQYEPCPRCDTPDPKKVKFTWWGSAYGPAMFSHVRCRECGYAYNGRTGRSNLIPIILFVTLPALLIVAIVIVTIFIVINRLTPPP
jgi:hypothetical protein